MKTVDYIIRKIPIEIWHLFRLLCLNQNKSANKKLQEMILEETKKGGG